MKTNMYKSSLSIVLAIAIGYWFVNPYEKGPVFYASIQSLVILGYTVFLTGTLNRIKTAHMIASKRDTKDQGNVTVEIYLRKI